MTAPHETAYPRLKPDPSARELELHYTPSADDLTFIQGLSKQPTIRLAVMLHLKTLPRRGQFGALSEIPERITRHVADAMGYRRTFTTRDLDDYDASRMKREHIAQVRSYLNVRPLGEPGRRWLRTVAENAAQTKHLLPDIINVMVEELYHHRYELPAFRTLDEMAASAREAVHEVHFERISGSLTALARKRIDELLTVAPGQTHSGWQALKREPKRPGNKEVRFYLQHIERLQKLGEMIPALEMPVPKLKYFRAMARALDASDLAELKAAKRYALAAVFIRSQHGKTLDDAADLFIRLMQNMENTAQKNLMTYQVEHIKRTDNLVAQLKDILQAYQIDGTDSQRIHAIGDVIPDLAQALAECEEHMAYAGKNFLPFLAKPYAGQRALLLNCIEVMDLHTSSQDPVMDRLIKALDRLRHQRRDVVDVASLGLNMDSDFGWLSANWRRHLFPKAWGADKGGWMQRRYFELAVLFQIKDELKSGDLFVPGGERYDDYREELVDEATFQEELASYGEVSGISTDPVGFVNVLRDQLRTKCKEVDARFPDNVHADIVDGRLILKKLQRTELSKAIALVDHLITERLPETSIVDVLVDSTSWVDLSKHFKPLAGTSSRIRDLHHRVVTTLFCYGCNLGPTQTVRSVRGFSRRQMAWLNLKYVTDDTLERATVDTINLYNKFELPGYWGSGKSASADGTKWSVYEQNLLSEYHIRYGGYGGIGYYHVSDKYIALFSRFIPCGAYEAIYILDGLIENRSDIRPDTVHGDTQAQNFPVFGLAHLLGIDLMPRIRNIKDLSLSKPDGQASYPHIQSLFGEGSIDWNLIETHLHDMLRVAVSIKTGKISASTILRRLGNYSRKNKLYFAFKELGRVIRTLFLLRYIDDVDVRKTIHAATNKSEEFNNFTKWAFFGGQGIIAENVLHEQQKIVGYNHLVANLVILHNVEQMSRVLAELRDEGIEISPEVLAGLSPYRTAHINRFGDYTVDTSREVTPIDFARRILREAEDSALTASEGGALV
ncbi:Tn3 family transposase [Rhodanobacter sp. BL-MT-08]